jgi:hypothetical protein
MCPIINLPKRKTTDETTLNRKINRSFYNSPEWKALRKEKLSLDPICQLCQDAKANGIVHKKRIAISTLSNIETLYDITEVLSVCDPCHRKEQLRQRKEANELRRKK